MSSVTTQVVGCTGDMNEELEEIEVKF